MSKIKNLLYKVTGTTSDSDLQPKEVLSYSFAGFGQNLICALITSYLIVFLTDSVGLNAEWLAWLFLAARLFDAFNDPIMGSIVDKTKTKWGKLRPYLLFTPVPIGILTVLCFLRFKGASQTSAFIYIAIIYVLWGIVYTIVDVPYWGLSTALTSDTEKRNVLLTIARLLSTLGTGIVTITIPLFMQIVQSNAIKHASQGNDLTKKLLEQYQAFKEQPLAKFREFVGVENFAKLTDTTKYIIDKDLLNNTTLGSYADNAYHSQIMNYQTGAADGLQILFLIVSIVIVILAIPTFFIGFKYTKERFNDNIDNKTLKENIAILFKNKPLLLIVLSGVLGGARFVFTVSGIYYAKYTLSNVSLSTAISILVVPGGLIASVLTPYLSKKFGKRNLFIYSHLIGGFFFILAFIIGIIFPDNKGRIGTGGSTAAIVAGAIALVVSGIPSGFANILSYAMISDTVDYLEHKTGKRAEGICFAMQTFISKVGMALTAFIALIIISAQFGFKANAPQPTNVLQNIWLASILIPGISTILCAVPLFFYKLTEKEQARMVKEIEERKEKEAEASNIIDATLI